ncbi:E3 ubiquitin/ISG15 ligase TRIM25 [Hyla sarda]|uniref:E3 ubiquitin/ISG15 ligase TRIM25 n=1 Tax=Hyla sarda TaxID=327740 RepID=UPI0024C2BF66|nr:E3 ubiquitin/ISG15 ligase TRIM25 [Hyla sarda]
MAQSLEEMAEELTCSICLSLFTTPVTLPCGHNFCSQCLDLSWKGVQDAQYNCPQCRYVFSSKPELRKNTLLSNLVSQVMAARREDPDHQEEELEDETPDSAPNKEAVLCDSCRKEAASKTCLTCMASFCQEHLMPHLQSPAFLDHLLSQPLRDLKERKCTEHNKLMDHYCWEHGQCLCAYCALGHKTCRTYTLREAKHQKELHYTNMLRSVNQKIEKAANTAEEVKSEQRRLLENTKKKKELIEAEFEEMKSLIEEERRAAMAKIEEEERKVTSKFSYTQNVLAKKRQEYERMSSRVHSLLQEQDDLQFLKRASKLKDTTSKEPYKPKTEFDEKLLQSIYKKTVSLKEIIRSSFCQTETSVYKCQPTARTSGAEPMSGGDEAGRWKNPATPKQEEKPNKNKPKFKKGSKSTEADASETTPQQKTQSTSGARAPDPRETLMMSAEKLSADPRTVHKKILVSDLLTKLSVSDHPQNYPEDRKRFVSCSQFLCSQGFSQGLHYWEILKEGGHFSGLGVAYQSIARTGPESRLGRNKVSWCIEWCNGKLQAWHDDKQTDLTCPNTNKYGVLINCDQGTVSFYCIGKKCSEIYKFRARFSEPLYPAFWMFSSHTSLTLNAFNMEP